MESTKERIDFRPIGKSEPQWLYKLRFEAWNFYQDSELPDRASHLWRYTDPSLFAVDNPADLMNELSTSLLAGNGHKPSGDTTLLSSHPAIESDLLEKGVVLTELTSAIRENPELVERYIGGLIGPEFGYYESLNMALWNKGWFLYIPQNLVIEKPINIRSLTGKGANVQRLLIVIGDNSQVTIIDDNRSNGEKASGFVNNVVELNAGNGCNIKYVNLHRVAADISGLVSYRSRIGNDSAIHSIFGGFGGSTTKINAGTELAGRGANSRMDGIVFAVGKQKFDYHTRHHHTAGESFSDLDFKVILKDRANSAYTGLIRIEKDALNCEAYQENRNLLLNKGTRAESIPELEILTDQVRCTHGATMGPIDPEMVFYLRSRGFSRNEATKAIVEGFCSSILNRVPVDMAETIGGIVSEKLEGQINER